MSIKWVGSLAYVGDALVGSIRLRNNGYHASHLRWVSANLQPPRTPCKTEAGIKRRVERYVTIWLVAGKPNEEHL